MCVGKKNYAMKKSRIKNIIHITSRWHPHSIKFIFFPLGKRPTFTHTTALSNISATCGKHGLVHKDCKSENSRLRVTIHLNGGRVPFREEELFKSRGESGGTDSVVLLQSKVPHKHQQLATVLTLPWDELHHIYRPRTVPSVWYEPHSSLTKQLPQLKPIHPRLWIPWPITNTLHKFSGLACVRRLWSTWSVSQ
jgi:hypothetical protein